MLLPFLDRLHDVCCSFSLRRFDGSETTTSGISADFGAFAHFSSSSVPDSPKLAARDRGATESASAEQL